MPGALCSCRCLCAGTRILTTNPENAGAGRGRGRLKSHWMSCASLLPARPAGGQFAQAAAIATASAITSVRRILLSAQTLHHLQGTAAASPQGSPSHPRGVQHEPVGAEQAAACWAADWQVRRRHPRARLPMHAAKDHWRASDVSLLHAPLPAGPPRDFSSRHAERHGEQGGLPEP